jgi:hypothetical protein
VYNPWKQELRQYVSTAKAAYSLRANVLEDDHFTLQVEMFGKAQDVPLYNDDWYEGVAALVSYVNVKYGVPVQFADFSVMRAGTEAAQRMTATESQTFTGFMGHGHFGKGVDAHWDPGMLDVEKVQSFIQEDIMPLWQWHKFIDALFEGSEEFTGDPRWFKNDSTNPDYAGIADRPDHEDWNNFWDAAVRQIAG